MLGVRRLVLRALFSASGQGLVLGALPRLVLGARLHGLERLRLVNVPLYAGLRAWLGVVLRARLGVVRVVSGRRGGIRLRWPNERPRSSRRLVSRLWERHRRELFGGLVGFGCGPTGSTSLGPTGPTRGGLRRLTGLLSFCSGTLHFATFPAGSGLFHEHLTMPVDWHLDDQTGTRHNERRVSHHIYYGLPLEVGVNMR